MAGLTIPDVLRERASLQPNEKAFTYLDYERDWEGVAETITYSQLYRRALNVAAEMRLHGSTEDRAVIVAPQGLHYIDAFFGALLAGLIPVPLSVPVGGVVDERVKSVLLDAAPSVVLTTSAVAGDVAAYLEAQQDGPAPSLIEVDRVDVEARSGFRPGRHTRTATAYLQYTSGSTRAPAGVEVSYRNLLANFEQMFADYFADTGGVAPSDTTFVSWLPFYHDMGLLVGVCVPVLGGYHAVLTSPVAFLARPARWLQLLATYPHTFSAGPNFAFEVAARKTTDEELAGVDLGGVLGIINGSERVQPATLRRFTERFAPFNFPARALRPSYGMAEATVYIVTREPGEQHVVHFDSERLADGRVERCENTDGTALVSYGVPRSPILRIVDPDSSVESSPDAVGEIWVHGDNVATGYWRKPQETEYTFGAKLSGPSPGTPEGPWLRTGDLGFFHDGELFIIGRIKDLLIVYGRNHSPDDIEATIQLITRGRCVAIAVPDDGTEKLVAIAELKDREDAAGRFDTVKNEVTSAISTSHGLSIADLVLVPQGSIPITTSGKVRRQACVTQYQQDQFARLDA
ncbi:AMP-binding protein [Candidatus Mycobacterium wuenschmannii]|uniref:AMP-binding protein n=1 Tax=Candidatus Mycobacterium wuenschmannii TaxID=3027808 RepID=A0ABY8VYN1_9MYCO|nr:AMP-binding protein [Candidatus Mycobacterium wuenschmannii]WIM88708.1 AMP-binding protein [Candidatus Mycobacterium wuenschmannii]